MKEELLRELEQNIKSLEASSVKNNTLLVFFYLSGLYVFISVLGTTDLMLLLPTDTFKMPLIGFDLNLVYFYVLAPLVFFSLHFNILFNYHKHMQKLDKYQDESSLETIASSIYDYVYISIKNGWLDGLVVRSLMILFIYILPFFVFIAIYHRFAAYHDEWITTLHLTILCLDVALIYVSIKKNKIYFKRLYSANIIANIVGIIIIVIGLLEIDYFFRFFEPMVSKNYNSELIKNVEGKHIFNYYNVDGPRDTKTIRNPEFIESCNYYVFRWYCLFLNPEGDKPEDCFPRIVVKNKDIAKLSKASLYVPRLFSKDENKTTEKNLILEHGAKIHLANRNLRYANLENCILTRADMENTELQGANLEDAHLQGVTLHKAKLQDVNLINAKLQKADIDKAQLQGAKFYSANMINAEFVNTNLSGAKFSNANMTNAYFKDSNLSGAKFSSANMTKAYFKDSNLSGAKFSSVNMTNAEFVNTNLSGAKFSRANMTNADFGDNNLSGAKMTNTDFSGSSLIGVNFRDATLISVDFYKVIFRDVSFNEANLTAVSFSDINLKDKKAISFKKTKICCINIPKNIKSSLDLNASQLRYVVSIDINTSKYRTSDERRIFYINEMKNIAKKENSSKLPEKKLKELDDLLKKSCKKVKLKDTKLKEICPKDNS